MRRISRPERYDTPKNAAASLRAMADVIEQRNDWVAVYVSSSYATKDEVVAALAKKGLRLVERA